uniref:Uncharacterized protein n=1 Tax=Chelydra serpentina TaxID=8475 RepID=A0A8C3XWF7_CHESE
WKYEEKLHSGPPINTAALYLNLKFHGVAIVGILTQKGVVRAGGRESQGYCVWGGCSGTATLTSVLLLAAGLPSELDSWRSTAAGREPSSDGRVGASSSPEVVVWYCHPYFCPVA